MRVAILSYDNSALFELGCAVELFALQRPEFDDWYKAEVVTFSEQPINVTGGLQLISKPIKSFKAYDMLVIPSWPVEESVVPEKLSIALRQFATRGGRLVSFCSGAFLLAELDLINGKKATTHWRYAEQFKKRYPQVDYSDDVLYVYDQQVGCSAGSSAAIDLGLEIIRRDFGHQAANTVARRLVLSAHRDGGQSQFVDTPVAKHSTHFSATLDWAIQHLDTPLSINSLALRACMSRRTFDRKFRSSMNMSPKEWLMQQRLFLAKQMLENSNHSIEAVAQSAGFKTSLNLRNSFRTQFKTSPSRYRQQFGVKTC